MAAADGYRNQADECRRHAETEAEDGDRFAWLFLESAFIQLSDEASRMGAPAPSRPSVKTTKKVKGRKRR